MTPPLEKLPPPPPETRVGEYFTSGLFCLQRKHLAHEYFVTIFFHGEELLAPSPIPKLKDHSLSAVRDWLFNLFAVTLHIGGRSSIRNLRTRQPVVTGTNSVSKFVMLATYPVMSPRTAYSTAIPGTFCWWCNCPSRDRNNVQRAHQSTRAENKCLLKTKRNLLYIRNQPVPRSKHFPPRL